MGDKKNKQVKLQPEYRKLTYSEKMVPVLRLSGVWLEQNGFKIGGRVSISIEQNQLTIKPL